MIERPDRSEYAPYYHRYIKRVPDGDVLEVLERENAATVELLGKINEERAGYRYQPGKWSIREVVGHLTDIERVFCYRALAFARNDPMPLPSIEQDDYVRHSNYAEQRFADIAEQFRITRLGTLAMFRSFDPSTLMRRGTASDVEFTVRAIAYIIAGHELHHIGVIKEKYL